MNCILLLLLLCSCGNRFCAEAGQACGRQEDSSCQPDRHCACEPCRERDVCDMARGRDEGYGREQEDNCKRGMDESCGRSRDESCGILRDRDEGCQREHCDMPGITPPPWNNRNMRGETCGCEE